jgi:hypothetical protein
LQGLATAIFCRACASPVANPLPRHLRCYSSCSWPAIHLSPPLPGSLAIFRCNATTACCKLLLVACCCYPISCRSHGTILMSQKSLPHFSAFKGMLSMYLRPAVTMLSVCLGGGPKFDLTLQPPPSNINNYYSSLSIRLNMIILLGEAHRRI